MRLALLVLAVVTLLGAAAPAFAQGVEGERNTGVDQVAFVLYLTTPIWPWGDAYFDRAIDRVKYETWVLYLDPSIMTPSSDGRPEHGLR